MAGLKRDVYMAGLIHELTELTVDIEAENTWNKLIAFKNGKDSVYKVRRPKPVLYDSLEPIETCTSWAKNTRNIFDSFKCNVS